MIWAWVRARNINGAVKMELVRHHMELSSANSQILTLKPVANVCLPFCRQGVIFENRKSFSSK